MLKSPYCKFLPVSVFTKPKTVLAKKNTNYCNCQNRNWRFWQLGREQMGLLASWGNLRSSLGLEDKHTNLNIPTKMNGSETADLANI